MARKTTPKKPALRTARRGSPRVAALPPAAAPRRRPPVAAAKAVAAGRKLNAWTAPEVEEAFRRFHAANPEPKGELEHVNAYTLLVAVVLSAQATDAGVNKATRPLFAVADSPARMVELGEAKLRDYIRSVGLYPTKARNVIALSQKLLAEHGLSLIHI